jgi:hypothetical protein
MSTIVRGLNISTNCVSVDDFIERYAARADRDSIFVGVPITPRLTTIDTECAFLFSLANRRPVLAGTCVVRTFPDRHNAYRRQGLRLGIIRLGPDSRRVFAALGSPMTRAFMTAATLVEFESQLPTQLTDQVSAN